MERPLFPIPFLERLFRPYETNVESDGYPQVSVFLVGVTVIRWAVRRAILVLARQWLPLRRRALLFRAVVPRRYWFPAVLMLSRAHGALARLAGSREYASRELSCIDGWLGELTLSGPFAVDYKVVGAEQLRRAPDDQGGILCCMVHLPLTPMTMRACLDLGAAPEYIVAAPHNINQDGRWLPAGAGEGLKAIAPGPFTLLQARKVLQQGGRLASMLDEDVGTPLRPSLMRLAGSVGARVVFCCAEMDAERNLVVTYRNLLHPIPDTEEKVSANLAAVDEERQRVLARLRGPVLGSGSIACHLGRAGS